MISFKVNKYKTSFIIISFIVAIIVANRGNTRDTLVYYEVFSTILDYPMFSPADFYYSANMEIGFGWILYLSRIFSESFFYPSLIISILTFYFIYKIVSHLYKESYKNAGGIYMYTLCIYLSSGYFLMQQFMQIRQGLAIPIALLSLSFLLKDNLKKFIFLAILAVSIHQASFPIVIIGIMVSFYIKRNNLSLMNFKFMLVISVVIILILSKFIILNLVVGLSSRLTAYAYSSFSEPISMFRLPNIKSLIIFIFIIFLFNIELYKNKFLTLLVVFYSLSLAFRLGFSDFGILSGRLGAAFSISEIFILPFLLHRFKYSVFLALLYVTIQGILTYMYQAPYVIEDYFKPLY